MQSIVIAFSFRPEDCLIRQRGYEVINRYKGGRVGRMLSPTLVSEK
jgi:hypothetical protein